MAAALWRQNLQPASYKGVGFKVDVDAKSGGRRNVTHQFPKRDTPYTEDMGRRARRFTVTGYIITGPNNPDYQSARDALVAVLETEGPGLLVHPTLGTDMVNADVYTITERRERGGIAEFEMVFVEAGEDVFSSPVVDTAAAAISAAQSAIQSFLSSSDIISL